MSQVATKKKLKISNERVSVTGHFHEQGSVLKGDAEGYCDGFEVEISMETEESLEEINNLIRLSRQMCFTEKALAGAVTITVKQNINGKMTEF